MSHDRHAVAVTGLGAVTPHGIGVPALWAGILAGRPTAAPIRRFDASGHRVTFACEVDDELVVPRLPRRLVRATDPFARFALLAAQEALAQAGLLTPDADTEAGATRIPMTGADPDRVGVLIASGAGGITEVTQQHERLLADGPDRVRPYLSIAMPVNMAAGQVALRHGLRGPAAAVVSACASGADAIGHALDLLRAGRADVVVAGGAEAAVTPLTIAGFDAAGAMSRRTDDPVGASRPFAADRDGFVAGDGAGVLVLETAAHATARGATVLGWLHGYGASNDAHDPTQPPADGEGAARAIRLALADAGVAADRVGHVNAHATSTPAGDLAEASALRTALGTDVPPVTAPKGSIGHLMGGAGAVEAILGLLACTAGTIPPTATTPAVDPAVDLDVVLREARPVDPDRVALSTSFGFGGHNAVLVLAGPEGRP